MVVLSIGILIGLVIAALILLAVAHFRPVLERTINQVISITKQKGEILEPEDTEVEEWVESLPNK